MIRIGDQHTAPRRTRIPPRPSTIICMRGWSIPLGRWMGVELRMHAFFLLLAVVCLGISSADGVGRGLGLFLVLVMTVVTRETARLLVAAWMGLRLRAILLLPIGGLFAYGTPESQEKANQGVGQFAMALAGPVANIATAAALAAVFLGAAGDVKLLDQPWITSAYLLRSMVWMQACMGLLHLLPAYPLDCGRLLRGSFARKHGLAPTGRTATGLGQLLALAAMVGGMLLHSPWLIIAGFFIMIGAQVEDQGVFFQSVVDTVRMREVMLTDFAILSPSDTLADALSRCVHSLQEDFPVVRGPQLVGIVSRQRIVDALRNDGNGYVQSVMSPRLPSGAARRHVGDYDSAHHGRTWTFADSGNRKRQGRGHCERAKSDEFDVAAGGATQAGTPGIRGIGADERRRRDCSNTKTSCIQTHCPGPLPGGNPHRQPGRHYSARPGCAEAG